MGMPGMNMGEMQAYANAAPASDIAPKASNSMTVAELRNGLNPVTGYYDNYDAASFFADAAIPNKTKLETVFGRFIANMLTANAGFESACIEIISGNLTAQKGGN